MSGGEAVIHTKRREDILEYIQRVLLLDALKSEIISKINTYVRKTGERPNICYLGKRTLRIAIQNYNLECVPALTELNTFFGLKIMEVNEDNYVAVGA